MGWHLNVASVHLNRVKVKRWKQQFKTKTLVFFVCWLQKDDNALLIAFRHHFCISLLPEIALQAAAPVCRVYAVCMTHVLIHWDYLNHNTLKGYRARKNIFLCFAWVVYLKGTTLNMFVAGSITALVCYWLKLWLLIESKFESRFYCQTRSWQKH